MTVTTLRNSANARVSASALTAMTPSPSMNEVASAVVTSMIGGILMWKKAGKALLAAASLSVPACMITG